MAGQPADPSRFPRVGGVGRRGSGGGGKPVVFEAEVTRHNCHEQNYADHREPTWPPAGLMVPALAQDVLHRRTPDHHANPPATTIRRLAGRADERTCNPKAKDKSNPQINYLEQSLPPGARLADARGGREEATTRPVAPVRATGQVSVHP